MRTLKKNKQKMFFSKPNDSGSEDIYARDDDGNIIYINVDGDQVPVLAETDATYTEPTVFYGNISFNSGETTLAEYGLNTSNYNAVINIEKDKFDFDERTLIWHESEPAIDVSGNAIPESADYRVVAIKKSLNEERLILKKRVDDE